MSDAFCGEIRMFAGNYAPVKWSFCSGQSIPITQNEALYSLIGTTYGGDGVRFFSLPNLVCRVPVHVGAGPDMQIERVLGLPGGSAQVSLTVDQIPSHNHTPDGSKAPAQYTELQDHILAKVEPDASLYVSTANTTQALINGTVTSTGSNTPHNNLMPSLCVSFIICLKGAYPQQR